MKKLPFFFLILTLGLTSCVSKKKFLDLQDDCGDIQITLDRRTRELNDCEKKKADLKAQIKVLENQLASEEKRAEELKKDLDFVKKSNENLLNRLSDLSVISKEGAESINKSLEAISNQSSYIQDLTSELQRKDSVNMALVLNLKRSLANINDEDVQIEVKKGVVYISISDKLLFQSGKADINPRAQEVLGKVAKVIKDHQNLEILVEGHTDNVPISTECMKDNWDLSVKRATAVIRVLQWRYEVDPRRLTAGGRSEFIPKATNETEAGRQTNRRTEIILTPKLDEFFKLLEYPEGEGGQ